MGTQFLEIHSPFDCQYTLKYIDYEYYMGRFMNEYQFTSGKSITLMDSYLIIYNK